MSSELNTFDIDIIVIHCMFQDLIVRDSKAHSIYIQGQVAAYREIIQFVKRMEHEARGE